MSAPPHPDERLNDPTYLRDHSVAEVRLATGASAATIYLRRSAHGIVTRHVSFRLSVWESLAQRAEAMDITPAALIERLIERLIESNEARWMS